MTPDEERDGRIVRGVAKRCGVERERVRPRVEDDVLVIGVEGCTEDQHRVACALMRFQLGDGVPWRVVRDEPPGHEPKYTVEKMRELIAHFGTAPDGHLDGLFATRCANFPEDASLEQTLDFVRDMRDECVFSAGASDGVLTIMSMMLEEYPEQPDAMERRRAKLRGARGE